jgi:uncharacterized short protein YbdD (DUF466 family)
LTDFWLRILLVLKEVVGDGEYIRYRRHLRAKHPDAPVLNAKDFYLSRLEDKYARPCRCC